MVRGTQRQVRRRKVDKSERKVKEAYWHFRQWWGVRDSVTKAAEKLKMPRDEVVKTLGLDQLVTSGTEK